MDFRINEGAFQAMLKSIWIGLTVINWERNTRRFNSSFPGNFHRLIYSRSQMESILYKRIQYAKHFYPEQTLFKTTMLNWKKFQFCEIQDHTIHNFKGIKKFALHLMFYIYSYLLKFVSIIFNAFKLVPTSIRDPCVTFIKESISSSFLCVRLPQITLKNHSRTPTFSD